MERQKSKADIFMEELENECMKRGLQPPKRVTRTGCFVTISLKCQEKEMTISEEQDNDIQTANKHIKDIKKK